MKRVLVYAFKPKNLILNFSVLIGAFLFGSIMHEIIVATTGADDVFPFGCFMMLFGLVGLGFFANWQEEIIQFQLSVSMGCTRKKFFVSYAVQYFLLMLIDWIVAFLLQELEMFRLRMMYPDYPVAMNLGIVFHPATFLLVPIFLTCFGLFIGGIGIRFGGNSKWFVIILWIALCLGLTKVENGAYMIRLMQLPAYAYAIIALVISVILGVVAALLMRKQRVDI